MKVARFVLALTFATCSLRADAQNRGSRRPGNPNKRTSAIALKLNSPIENRFSGMGNPDEQAHVYRVTMPEEDDVLVFHVSASERTQLMIRTRGGDKNLQLRRSGVPQYAAMGDGKEFLVHTDPLPKDDYLVFVRPYDGKSVGKYRLEARLLGKGKMEPLAFDNPFEDRFSGEGNRDDQARAYLLDVGADDDEITVRIRADHENCQGAIYNRSGDRVKILDGARKPLYAGMSGGKDTTFTTPPLTANIYWLVIQPRDDRAAGKFSVTVKSKFHTATNPASTEDRLIAVRKQIEETKETLERLEEEEKELLKETGKQEEN